MRLVTDEQNDIAGANRWKPRGGFIPIARLIFYFVALGGTIFLAQVVTLIVALAFGAGFDLSRFSDFGQIPLWFITVSYIASALAAIPLTLVFVRYVDKRPVETFGLSGEGSWRTELAVGTALGISLPCIIFGISYFAGWSHINGSLFNVSWHQMVLTLAETLLLMIAIAFMEETISRGYILQTLKWGYGPVVALLFSSLLFGAAHSLNPGASVAGFIGTTTAGLLMGYSYLITKRLWLGIGIHFGWNFALGPILGFPVSGINVTGWIVQTFKGPSLWTGGKFGPEASLPGVFVLLLGFAVVRFYAKFVKQPGFIRKEFGESVRISKKV